jgi:transposase
MDRSNEAVEGRSEGFSGKLARRTRSDARVWSPEAKGRAVFESMKLGARICEVAEAIRRHSSAADDVATVGA